MREATRADAAIALQKLAQTEEGQIFLSYLVHRFGYTRRSTWTEPHPQLAEGQRTVAIEIGILMEADPVQLKQLEDTDDDRSTFT